MSTPTSSSTTSPAPFDPLDFLQQFVVGISGGVVFRTANGSSILSTIKEGDIINPAQVREAIDIIAGYFKPPGLSPEMDIAGTQQLAAFLAEIIKYRHRCGREASSRFTAYSMGNAAAALRQVLKPQTPTGKN